MFINIKISSKNYKSLKNFITFFITFCETNNLNFKLFLKYFKQRQKKFNFTILKSPHVNKTAQEQFEYRIFSKQINLYSFQLIKFLIILKKIQIALFSDIKVQIKFFYNKKKINKIKRKTFNPNNFKMQLFQTKTSIELQQKKKIEFYLNLFDIYGEISLKNLFR